MRDRLKELIKDSTHYGYDDEFLLDRVTDYLLENGVIVPPVKAGQTVWVYNQTNNNIYKNTVICIKVEGTSRYKNKISVKYTNQRGEISIRKFAWSQIGKQVFLTEQEAVEALAERNRNE